MTKLSQKLNLKSLTLKSLIGAAIVLILGLVAGTGIGLNIAPDGEVIIETDFTMELADEQVPTIIETEEGQIEVLSVPTVEAIDGSKIKECPEIKERELDIHICVNVSTVQLICISIIVLSIAFTINVSIKATTELVTTFIDRKHKKIDLTNNETVQTKPNDINKRLRNQELAELIRQVELIQNIVGLVNINLCALHLNFLHAIETDPNNVIFIMEMAQKYFIDMHGNRYMSKKFQEWANVHNVNITGLFNKY